MDASEPRNVPDIELMLTPIRTLTGIGLGKSLSSIYTTLIQPFARGRVELASTDPREHPRIHYEALSDERDVAVCRKATRFAIHVAEQFTKTGYPHPAPLTFAPSMDLDYLDSLYAKRDRTLKPQAAGNLPDHKPAPDVPGVGESKHSSSSEDAALEKQQAKVAKTDWRSVTDEEIDAYAKRVCVTSLHFSSTCRMSLGPEDGVVDQRLRVHGMRNLRIADASVFPKIPSAHTMAPTVMVAERCADFLKREWEERKEK
jgi:choline dehydrogenase-like flavoprotein